MSAANLGCQPEHQILFVQDMLQNAAYEYGKTRDELRSAIACGLPVSFTNMLTANMLEAKNRLEVEALHYFDNIYDGSEE